MTATSPIPTPGFQHAMSEDGLTLTSTWTRVDGARVTATASWRTTEQAEANRATTEESFERRVAPSIAPRVDDLDQQGHWRVRMRKTGHGSPYLLHARRLRFRWVPDPVARLRQDGRWHPALGAAWLTVAVMVGVRPLTPSPTEESR